MGVAGLLRTLKPIASESVDLNHDVGTIIFDGHASMHRSASKSHVAVDFVLNNDLRPLVLDMLVEMRRFERAGWLVVVVFDGATPPSKARTSQSRSGNRAKNLNECRALQACGPVNKLELARLAKNAVEFTTSTVAKVSQMLKHSLRADAECITAPFEADPQLKVLEDIYSRPGQRCFVRANDSDLVVLGVQNLLWDVTWGKDGLVGNCIRLSKILHPPGGVFADSSIAFDFLRQLHGVDSGRLASADDALASWSSDEGAVMAKLRNYGCVAGSDYTKFEGIGPMRALDIAMPRGRTLSPDEIATALTTARLPQEVVLAQLKASMDMFCHPIVWDPHTGAHRHLSGVESSAGITVNTGTLGTPEVAAGILAQEICPRTREPWSESVAVNMEGLPPRLPPPLPSSSGHGGRASSSAGQRGTGGRANSSSGRGGRGGRAPMSSDRGGRGGRAPMSSGRGGRGGRASSSSGRVGRGGRASSSPGHGGRARQGKRRAPPLGGARGGNYKRAGFGILPDADMDFSTWTVEALREFLSAFRCLEMTGVSRFPKPQLVTLARTCVEVVREAGLVNSSVAFRHPVISPEQPPQPGTSPPPGTVWQEWEELRPNLPEISDNIIIRWLASRGSLKGSTGRVLYRGLQRVLDFGALGQLSGKTCGVNGGLMWLKFRASASMRQVRYDVTAALEVERVEEIDNTDEAEEGEQVDQPRHVATRVVQASCGCQSGAGGGCHHVCQLLQLTRLLQLTEIELSQWNPKSPTSVACKWILNHCGAGRDNRNNVLHRKPMDKIAQSMRTLRDPKTHPFSGGEHEKVKTRGVVAVDRADGYSPHPDYGMWAEAKGHYDEAASYTQEQKAKLDDFVNRGRKEFTKESAEGVPLQSTFSEKCIEFLPPEVR